MSRIPVFNWNIFVISSFAKSNLRDFRCSLRGNLEFVLRVCNVSPACTFFLAALFIVLGEGKITDENTNDELHKIK